MAAEAQVDGPVVVNVGCGTGTSLNEIIGVLNGLLGTDLQPLYDKPRPGDIMHSWADIGAAEKLIGYRPAVGFQEGLRKTIDWYRNNL